MLALRRIYGALCSKGLNRVWLSNYQTYTIYGSFNSDEKMLYNDIMTTKKKKIANEEDLS